MKLKILIVALYITTCFPSDWDFLSFHGYGSLGVAYQDNDEVLYRNSIHTSKGSQGDLSLSNYSNFGLQLDLALMDNLKFTVQGTMYEGNSEGSLLELGWANLNYQVSDSLNFKVGKMRIPAFMYSDILNVSYAYDWVKLPEMYSIIPFENYTGIEVNHDFTFDDLSIISTMRFGKSNSTRVNSSGIESAQELEQMKGFAIKLVNDKLILRVTYNQNHLKVKSKDLDTLTSRLIALGISSITQAVNYYTPKEIKYWQIGGRYDFDNIYLTGEYMRISSNSFLANNRSWYIGSGYNFKKWSPFVLYSKTRSSSNYENIVVNGNMPGGVVRAVTATNQALGSVYKINSIQSETKSLGLRYDLSKNSVIKFQYDHHKELKDEGLSINFSPDKNVNIHVFSTAINFIF